MFEEDNPIVGLARLNTYDELIKQYINDKKGTPLWVGTRQQYESEKANIPDGTFVIITDGEEGTTSIIGLDSIRQLFKGGK